MARNDSWGRVRHKAAKARAGSDMACAVCGWKSPIESNRYGGPPLIHAHHVLPVSRGGTDDPSNLVLLCPNHHAIVHAIWGTKKYDGPEVAADLLAALREIDAIGFTGYAVRRAQERGTEAPL